MNGILNCVRRGRIAFLVIVSWIIIVIGCGGGGTNGGSSSGSDGVGPGNISSRSFLMGFTTWPYAATITAVGDTYTKIQTHGDIVTLQLDGGIPWPEAYNNDATYHANVEGTLALHLSNLDPDTPICLSVAPLVTGRNAPADYWGSGTNLPRPSPWHTYDFGDQQLVTAYTNYLLNLINRFDPEYCNYGIEATEYIRNHRNNPARISEFLNFLQQVYTNLKAAHPDLTVFISATLQAPQSSDALLVKSYASQIASCTDILGVSTYGYIFYGHANSGDPANLPVDWLSQAQDYAPGKPLAIAETGWIAEDMVISAYGLSVPGNPTWQAEYVQKLLSEADRLDALFVTWWGIVDYDTLWQNTLGQDPLARIWRDTGLYDGNVQSRESIAEWDAWLAKPLR